jgi:tetratricopeptide (TPR) repeat protein
MRRRLMALSFLVALCVPAFADDYETCLERDGEHSIAACSRIITAGHPGQDKLATAYALRATIYRNGGAYDAAIADFTQAIELLQKIASGDVVAAAYVARGGAYSLKGDLENAARDYRKALALNPANDQAAEGLRTIEAETAAVATPESRPEPPAVAPPNRPLPPEIPIRAGVLRLVETDRFFANAPPISVAEYSYDQWSSSTVNGVRGKTSLTYSSAVTRLRPGIVEEQTTMRTVSTYSVTSRSSSNTVFVGAANGLIGLGYQNAATTVIPRMKPITVNSKQILLHIGNLQGTVFPARIGNRFSYEAGFETGNSSQPDDEMTTASACVFSEKYAARSFHADLSGAAYQLDCEDRTIYKRNKALSRNYQSRTLFFEDLGISIRVDPVDSTERIIQTYFENETTETATLRSFSLAR